MNIVTLDYETHWADDYTLSKMSTESYVRDPRFEMILCSVKMNAEPAFWVPQSDFEYLVRKEIDWTNTTCNAHHAQFDGAILNWHFGVRPAFWLDTLSMARVVDGPKAGNSLEKLCLRHGIGEKGDYVQTAKGMRLSDFTPQQLEYYGQYSCNDADKTYQLAEIFIPHIPYDELRLIDATIRMFTEPVFVGDVAKLAGAVKSERERKYTMLAKMGFLCPKCKGVGGLPALFDIGEMGTYTAPCKYCKGLGIDKKPFNSGNQFAALLRAAGVEPQLKPSPKPGKDPIYAFARTDSAMQALLEDDDEDVRFLAEARVGVKSNIIESRAQRFLDCAQRGLMPVYTRHAGAHTLRCSGGDGTNWLNMSNQTATRPEMAVLKQSIMAPPGHMIDAADSGQGEARILAWLARQLDLIEAFAQGRDVYSEHATTVYGREVNRKKVKDDYIPGQVGKICILNMGFGGGWYTNAVNFLKGILGAPPIQFKLEDMNALGIDPTPFLNNPNKIAQVSAMPSRLEFEPRVVHCIVTEALVRRYRVRMDKIAGKAGFWNLNEKVINCMISGEEMQFGGPAPGIFRTGKDKLWLPNGLYLRYDGISRDEGGNASYYDGRKRTKIYGSLLTENEVQCLHRLIVGDQLLQIGERYKIALWPYDEVVCVVPENQACEALSYMLQCLSTTPSYTPGLPLMAEGGVGPSYAEAKPADKMHCSMCRTPT